MIDIIHYRVPVAYSQLKKQYINEVILKTDPWLPSTRETLDNLLNREFFLYRRVVAGGDEDLAKEHLRSQLREKVVVDRQTVWSEVVSGHRSQGIFRSVEQGEEGVFEAGHGSFKTPLGRLRIPGWWSTKGFIFFAALAILVTITQLPLFDRQEETNCLAMLIFCTILWATEVSGSTQVVRGRAKDVRQSRFSLLPSLSPSWWSSYDACAPPTATIRVSAQQTQRSECLQQSCWIQPLTR